MSIYESLEGLGIDQSLKKYYSSKASVYKDSIASQFPDNVVGKSERFLLEGDYKSALDVLCASTARFLRSLPKTAL